VIRDEDDRVAGSLRKPGAQIVPELAAKSSNIAGDGQAVDREGSFSPVPRPALENAPRLRD
jgi:hypothetical protein